MKRFRFRLERVARVRDAQERAARLRWQAAQARALTAAAVVGEVERRLAGALGELRSAQAAGSLDLAEVLSAQGAVEAVALELQRERGNARSLLGEAERLRQPWTERRRDSLGLERWRERARAAHRREEEREETLESDESTLGRLARDRASHQAGERGVR